MDANQELPSVSQAARREEGFLPSSSTATEVLHFCSTAAAAQTDAQQRLQTCPATGFGAPEDFALLSVPSVHLTGAAEQMFWQVSARFPTPAVALLPSLAVGLLSMACCSEMWGFSPSPSKHAVLNALNAVQS